MGIWCQNLFGLPEQAHPLYSGVLPAHAYLRLTRFPCDSRRSRAEVHEADSRSDGHPEQEAVAGPRPNISKMKCLRLFVRSPRDSDDDTPPLYPHKRPSAEQVVLASRPAQQTPRNALITPPHPHATPPHSPPVTSPYLPHVWLTLHRTSRSKISLAMAQDVRGALIIIEGQPSPRIVAPTSTPMNRQRVPSETTKRCRYHQRGRQRCKMCQQVNCRNGNLCGNDHSSSRPVSPSDRLDSEVGR